MKKVVIGMAIIVFIISTLLLAVNQINVIGWYMVKPASAYPTDGWSTSTPEAEGIDSNGLVKGYQYIVDNKINAHSLLIIRNGRIADETYFYPYQKDDMINIHSCTKSIISALVGIAIEEGYIKGLDQKVLDFFPEKKIKNLSLQKQSITIRNLLTMSAGLAVKHPDDDMKSSGDWVQHVLDLEMSEDPGTKFNYSDATAHLLSAILQKTTGVSTYDYANTHLFKPMGIKAVWPADPQGINYGFGEINMTPRDMAKFGYLYLNKGKWEGKQLVPVKWVLESTKRQIKTGLGDDYGYLWWCPTIGFRASGAGEQVISVIPLFNSVTVSTNGLDYEKSFNFKPFDDSMKLWHLTQNPDGYDALKKLERQAALPKALKTALPSMASKISGKEYFFPGGNPLNIDYLLLDFTQEEKAIIKSKTFDGSQIDMTLPLDGSYIKDVSRQEKNDTLFMRGIWQDEKTFVVILEKSCRETLNFIFDGNKVTVQSLDRGKPLFDSLVGSQK